MVIDVDMACPLCFVEGMFLLIIRIKLESALEDKNSNEDANMSTFEVDSIELATPELFSGNEEDNSLNQDMNNEKTLKE